MAQFNQSFRDKHIREAAQKAAQEASASYNEAHVTAVAVGEELDNRSASRHKKSHGLLVGLLVLALVAIALLLWSIFGGAGSATRALGSAELAALNEGMKSGFGSAQADRDAKHKAIMDRFDAQDELLRELKGMCSLKKERCEREAEKSATAHIDKSKCYLADNTVLRVDDPHDGFNVRGLARGYATRVIDGERLYACLLKKKAPKKRWKPAPKPRKVTWVVGNCPAGTVFNRWENGKKICRRVKHATPRRIVDGGQGNPNNPGSGDRPEGHGGTPGNPGDRGESHGGTPGNPSAGGRAEGHGGTPGNPGAAPSGARGGDSGHGGASSNAGNAGNSGSNSGNSGAGASGNAGSGGNAGNSGSSGSNAGGNTGGAAGGGRGEGHGAGPAS